MAKTSAKSKGYRKTVQKKPYLSKKEIIIAAVIAAAVLLGLLLMNVLHTDGSLKVVDGVAQVGDTNSLIVNDGTGYNPLYFKVGQLADVEGYTLSAESITGDVNVNRFTYTPDAESPVDRITFTPYSMDGKLLAESTHASYVSSTNTTCTDLVSTEVSGHEVNYFTLRIVPTADADEAEITEENTAETDYTHVQAVSAYITAGERCISMQVRNEAMSEEEFVDDSVLLDAMNQVITALSFETK